MNIQLASDLHLEWLTNFPDYVGLLPAPEADILALTGDIHSCLKAFDVFEKWPVPVLYVLGNHEYYGEEYYSLLAQAKKRSQGSNVHLLEKTSYEVAGVRFLGCTMWTDYNLYGTQKKSMQESERGIRDHATIKIRDRKFFPRDAKTLHKASKSWLIEELTKPFEGKTIVLTHQGPHENSIHPGYRHHKLNPAYASDLSELFPLVDVWCHGHSHATVTYQHGRCNVIANPRGVPLNRRLIQGTDDLLFENPEFNPSFIFSI